MSKKEMAINNFFNNSNKTKKIYPEILSLNNHGNNTQFDRNKDEEPLTN